MTSILIGALAYQVLRYWSFFTKRGIRFTRGIPLLGTNYKVLFGREPVAVAMRRLYDRFPDSTIIGTYDIGGYPNYIICDPELIKLVFVKSTDKFVNRRFNVDPLLQNMPYMDMVISETLRKWSMVPTFDRNCNEATTIDIGAGKQLYIGVGEGMLLATYAMHHDPKYWQNPEEFDPERFNADNAKNIASGTYLPFGIGPRICPARRFATLETKAMFFSSAVRISTGVLCQNAKSVAIRRRSNYLIDQEWRLVELEAALVVYFFFRIPNFPNFDSQLIHNFL